MVGDRNCTRGHKAGDARGSALRVAYYRACFASTCLQREAQAQNEHGRTTVLQHSLIPVSSTSTRTRTRTSCDGPAAICHLSSVICHQPCKGSSLCSVISGRQFNLTATTDEPAPTEVYPDIPQYSQGPAPSRRGRVESRVIGIEPGKQICPPWVCPPSRRLNPACAA